MSKDNYYIKEISLKDEKLQEIFMNYHYLCRSGIRTAGKNTAYALYDKNNEDNQILAASIFGHLSNPMAAMSLFDGYRIGSNMPGAWELKRLVVHPKIQSTEYNMTSYFVSKCMRQLKADYDCKFILSYSSLDIHVGTIYAATNFKYYGIPGISEYYYISSEPSRSSFKQYTRKIDRRLRTEKYYYSGKQWPKLRWVFWFDQKLSKSCKWKERKYVKDEVLEAREKIQQKMNSIDPIVYYYENDEDERIIYKKLSELDD